MVIKIQINISNKAVYTILSVVIILLLGISVYAYGTAEPEKFGHTLGEIEGIPICKDEQIIKWEGSEWVCKEDNGITQETDPTIPSELEDGIDWSEISNIPSELSNGINWDDIKNIPPDFADEIDNTGTGGITTETDPTVPANIKDGISANEVTGLGDAAKTNKATPIYKYSKWCAHSGITLSRWCNPDYQDPNYESELLGYLVK